jgi:Rieske Fe-S protein
MGHFITGPFDIGDVSLWDVLSRLCSALGCFVAALVELGLPDEIMYQSRKKQKGKIFCETQF